RASLNIPTGRTGGKPSDVRLQPAQLGRLLVGPATLVVVEVVHLDLLVVVGPGVEGREDRRGRTGLVLQGRREESGGAAAGGEVDAVEVGEGAQGVRGAAPWGLVEQAGSTGRTASVNSRR